MSETPQKPPQIAEVRAWLAKVNAGLDSYKGEEPLVIPIGSTANILCNLIEVVEDLKRKVAVLEFDLVERMKAKTPSEKTPVQ